MPPKKAETPVKKRRGRPPKSATMSSKKSNTATATPSKRGRGRPPKNSTTPNTATATPASPAKKRGRPAKTESKKPGRPSLRKAPAKIPSAGIKKRGRPVGSTNAKKTTTTATKTKTKAKTPTPTSAAGKRGRPKGRHVSNLSTKLKSLIGSASKGRLVDLLFVLCERNAVVAKATSNALREEQTQREERSEANGNETVVDTEDAVQGGGVEQSEGDVLVVSSPGPGSGKTNGVGKAKSKARFSKGVDGTAERNVHVTVDDDQQFHTEQGTGLKSGYEADVEVEAEIPATATEAGEGEGISQEDAMAETETIAQAVSSMRDSAFPL